MNAKIVKVDNVRPEELAEYDLIGFGSGIYGLKHHKDLIGFIDKYAIHGQEMYSFFQPQETTGRDTTISSKRS